MTDNLVRAATSIAMSDTPIFEEAIGQKAPDAFLVWEGELMPLARVRDASPAEILSDVAATIAALQPTIDAVASAMQAVRNGARMQAAPEDLPYFAELRASLEATRGSFEHLIADVRARCGVAEAPLNPASHQME